MAASSFPFVSSETICEQFHILMPAGYVGKNTAPQHAHVSSPVPTGLCPDTHGQRHFADGVKLIISRWREYPGVSGAQCHTGIFKAETLPQLQRARVD